MFGQLTACTSFEIGTQHRAHHGDLGAELEKPPQSLFFGNFRDQIVHPTLCTAIITTKQLKRDLANVITEISAESVLRTWGPISLRYNSMEAVIARSYQGQYSGQ